ncbi:hypothetical protein ACRAVF_19115 [Bradyrhizobium oligotrophicum S58]
MTLIEAKATAAALHSEVQRAGAILNTFPRNERGLTPDAVKFSASYQRARADFNAAFDALRAHNALVWKLHKAAKVAA